MNKKKLDEKVKEMKWRKEWEMNRKKQECGINENKGGHKLTWIDEVI